jgi:toxin ParE1/3/4
MAGTSAKFEVLLTDGAAQDLESIHDYISEFDCLANANCVLDAVMAVVESLSRFPERGSYPKELVCLVDGRRDMQSVLARRLLGA